MEALYLVFLPAIAAGIIQGVTGFGAGIVLMVFLPLSYEVTQSAAMTGSICLVLCAAMVIRYRKHINYRKLAVPSILFLITSAAAITVSKNVNTELMKLILGVFLLALAIYFLFLSKKELEPKGIAALACIVISGICDGMFGVGGPLMVIYFLSKTRSKQEYLGSIQCFFLINHIASTILRFCNGIITVSNVPYMLLGMAGIIVGFIAANRITDRLNADLLKKVTYLLIGASGLFYTVTELVYFLK